MTVKIDLLEMDSEEAYLQHANAHLDFFLKNEVHTVDFPTIENLGQCFFLEVVRTWKVNGTRPVAFRIYLVEAKGNEQQPPKYHMDYFRDGDKTPIVEVVTLTHLTIKKVLTYGKTIIRNVV